MLEGKLLFSNDERLPKLQFACPVPPRFTLNVSLNKLWPPLSVNNSALMSFSIFNRGAADLSFIIMLILKDMQPK